MSYNISSLTSPNKVYTFSVQKDGNLTIYAINGKLVWQSGTGGIPGPGLIMQTDGNLVLYWNDGKGSWGPKWATNTTGQPGGILTMQDDGNLVIYLNGNPIWATNTVQGDSKYLHDKVFCTDGTNMVSDATCKVDGVFDANYASTACSDPANFITDPCQTYCSEQISGNSAFAGTCLTSFAEYCKKPENFRSEKCKEFCNQQVNSSEISSIACFTGAGSYCDVKSNFSDPECACINYDNSDDYKTHIEKFSTLKGVPSQCWSEPCAKATAKWSDLMSSINRTGTGSGVCPSQLTVCNQIMNLSDISAQSLGDINQSCESNQSRSSTSLTLPPDSTTPSPGSGSTPSTDSTAAPGVTTSPGVTGFFSSLFSSTKSSDSSSTTPSKTTTYIGLGGLSFCSSLSCLLLIILLIFMMSK